MKLWGILRFEAAYQLRRLPPWLYAAVLGVVAFLFVRGSFLADALYDDFYLNAPFIIASATVFTGLLWFLLAAGVAGEAGARDAESGMHPLVYTTPVRKAEHLGGRFLAAFLLNALILLAVPLGIMAAVYGPGVDPAVVGPFRPAAYLSAYGFLALPNAFVGTSIQYAWATLTRRGIASYLGSVLLFFVAYSGMILTTLMLERQDIAAVLDVFGHVFITSDLILGWTPIEKNTRLIALEGTLLWSRVFWVGVAAATLALTYLRFPFVHHTTSRGWWSLPRREIAQPPTSGGGELARGGISIPRVPKSFELRTRILQALAIARVSFRTMGLGRGGLPIMGAISALAVVVLPQNMESMGSPLLPRTEYVLTFLTTPITSALTPWLIIPLLLVFYAGELVWREREAGLGEITDAAPLPGWVPFAGRLAGLGLMLAAWMAMLMAAGMLTQMSMGYRHFEIGLYLKALFGLQLPQYILFAVLALVVQGVASQKYVGHLVALLSYAAILFAGWFGIEHNLLVYGAAPDWHYTDMRGFGSSLRPWRWFMLYWGAWAFLLAVVAQLFWVRGLERSLRARLAQVPGRLTPGLARAAALAMALVAGLGGFIFYNTNILNDYNTYAEGLERRAEYERRYARYAATPQPSVAGTRLRVEIHPSRGEVEIRGAYRLANRGTSPMDTIHVATVPGVETVGMGVDRPATQLVADDLLGHRIYLLQEPLRPGDSLSVRFHVRSRPRGFRNGGMDAAVTEASTYFKSAVLPGIGYQPRRELFKPAERREHGLRRRPMIPTLADATRDVTGESGDLLGSRDRGAFEAVIGTDADQIAVAPGALRRSWNERGRRYFHYATDAPIGDEYSFFSARYAVHRERWTPGGGGAPVEVEVYHHPRHSANLPRVLRSVRASLEHNTRAFGPYPYPFIRLVENPGSGVGAHADATTIDYTEGFSRYDPRLDPAGLDFPFAIMAHEMAHQWGVPYAFAEGAPLLSESFAWYAAMGVVEETYGREHLRRLLRFMRQPHPIPPIRQSVPLLRALDPYAAYRKGPFALFAMSEYMGQDRVNLAFRRLREKHGSGAPPLPTTLDLYRELRSVTPDTLQGLLHDLFAANTFWELATERASARRTPSGQWRVTLRLNARKVTVSPDGTETELPMNEWVQVGVFGRGSPGSEFGETLYLRSHRIRSGEQTIIVTVREKPADAGIDPYVVLTDVERFDNVEEVHVDR